jgi:DNA-directed RNA polymerase specialized sigma24 family protein
VSETGAKRNLQQADSERTRRFDALFQEHVAGIASYCGWRSRTAGDGEDAVAEVFLIAWRRLDDVPDGDQTRPWLYAVARRVLANQARADARRVRLNAELEAQPFRLGTEEDPRVVWSMRRWLRCLRVTARFCCWPSGRALPRPRSPGLCKSPR